MADKKLSSVSAVSDMNYVYAETSSGETVKISKADLATVVAEMESFVNKVFSKYSGAFGCFYVSHYGDDISVFEKNGVTIGYVKGATQDLPVAKDGFILSASFSLTEYGSFGIQFYTARGDQNDTNLYYRNNINKWTEWRKIAVS